MKNIILFFILLALCEYIRQKWEYTKVRHVTKCDWCKKELETTEVDAGETLICRDCSQLTGELNYN